MFSLGLVFLVAALVITILQLIFRIRKYNICKLFMYMSLEFSYNTLPHKIISVVNATKDKVDVLSTYPL